MYPFQSIDNTSLDVVLTRGNTSTRSMFIGDGTAATPAYGFNSDTDTGVFRSAANTIGFAAGGSSRMTIGATSNTLLDGQNLVLTGGDASGEGNIQFQATASNLYDTNLSHVSSDDMTMGMIASVTPTFAAANGPYIGLRGNTYSAVATQRGVVFIAAGNPGTPGTNEGEIRFLTGADAVRLRIGNTGLMTFEGTRFVLNASESAGAGAMDIKSVANNYSTINFLSSSGGTAGTVGYSNSGAALFPSSAWFGSRSASVTTRFVAVNSSIASYNSTGNWTFTPAASTSGSPTIFTITAPAHTGLSNAEANDIYFNLNRTVTFTGGGGAISTQRAVLIDGVTYAASAAQTLTQATTLYVKAPTAGTNVTIGTGYTFQAEGYSRFNQGGSAAALAVQRNSGAGPALLIVNGTGAAGLAEIQSGSSVYFGEGGSTTAVTLKQDRGYFISNAKDLFLSTDNATTAHIKLLATNGITQMGTRFEFSQGADVASANDLTLGNGGNAFVVTGTTQINAITTANWQYGSVVILAFSDSLTVKHNTAGGAGTAPIMLSGSADFSASSSDTLTLIYMNFGGGAGWVEIARTVI